MPDDPGDFEPPHPNGAAQPAARAKRPHAPWEFIVLSLFVALICIAIILGWTLVGSHSPERLDEPTAARLSVACNEAQARLKALPVSYPREGAEVVARIRRENGVLETMTRRFADTHPASKTEAAALVGWTTDWSRVIEARERFAHDLDTNRTAEFVLPASTGVKPVTGKMDDYVRENHPNLDACFTTALDAETVEGPRVYKKVTR
jgi:hypothetical protein